MFFLFEGNPPTNLPTEKEPEDILAGVEPAKTAPPPPPSGRAVSFKPTPPPVVPPMSPTRLDSARQVGVEAPPIVAKGPLISSSNVIWVVGIIAVIAIVGGGAFGLMKFLRKAQAPTVPLAPVFEEIVAPTVPSAEEVIPAAESPTVPSGPIDSDGDGLSDDEEKALGTDLNEPDTDQDGLFDNEEVKTYQTDPLKADTDGDGYNDGQEVRNGYNPKGEGTIIEIPTQ